MAEGESTRAWIQIAGKIGAIEQYTRDNEVYLGQLLDAINGLVYPVEKFDAKLASVVLCRLCTLLSARDETLIAKCSHYVTNIILRQEATFSEVAQNTCLKLFLSAMSSPSDGPVSDLLYATAAMARVHCKWKPEHMTSLVGGSSGVLFKFVPPSCSLQTCRVSINCLHAIVKHIGVSDDVMRRLVNHLLTLLETAATHSLDDLQLCKFLLACHKTLITMVPNLPRDSLMATLPSLLAILKDQMYYQWNSAGQTGAALQPAKRHARQSKKKPQKFLRKMDSLSSGSDQTLTDLSDSDVGGRGSEVGGGYGSRRTHLGQSRLQSSDSEHSDTESATQWIRLQNAKVRQHACIGLAAVLKQCGARTVFGYWSSFLPDTPAPPPPRVATPTLLTLVARDPLLHSRCAAIQLVNTIFEGSGPLLAAADDKPPTSVHAFKAFSQTLGGIIKEVHCQLLSALKAERSSVTIIQLLKCLVTIVTNCPYHQLTGSYISKVIVEVCRVATFSNTDVRTASLKCFAAILSSHSPLVEVESWLLPGDSITSGKTSDEQNGKGMDATEVPRPWVMTHCLRQFSTNDCPPIQAEAIQVMTALFKNYSHKVYQYCEDVYDHVVIAMMDVKARHHLLKLLEEFGRSLASYRQQIGPSKCTEMWEGLLAGPLMLCLKETSNFVARAIALDVMATIGDHTLQSLNHSQCMMMLSLVLNMSKDPDPGVCSAAIRTLGMFVTYGSLVEDTAFMLDTSQAIVSAVSAENNLLIRTKAAWSLANLCDSLPRLSDPLPNDTYNRLLQTSINACLDTDKVKSNGVRALGNLLGCMGTDQLRLCNQHIQPAMKAMAHCINIGAAKTRWNACYAARLALQSAPLCSAHSSATVAVTASLSTVIYECKNFKVRTKASLALCSLQRSCIVSPAHLAELLTAVIKALQCSDTLTDFSEYKHCASLKQQLCTALCHLTSQLVFEDVPEVSKTLTPLLPVIRQYMEETLRSTNSLENHATAIPNSKGEEDDHTSVPSIDIVTTSALKHLSQLRDSDSLVQENEQFLRELAMVFDKTKYTRSSHTACDLKPKT